MATYNMLFVCPPAPAHVKVTLRTLCELRLGQHTMYEHFVLIW